MNTFTHAHLDGDVLLYQVCRGCETDANFGDMHVLFSDFDECRKVFIARLQEIEATLQVPVVDIFFSSGTNWRKDVMPSYKNHRKDVRKPLAFNRLKEWIIDTYPTKVYPRLEADDLLGLKQTPDSIIVSIDKDMACVPGWFAHIRVTGEIELSRTTEDQARYFHMVQAFMGDRVDGYPGCTGIGIKTAQKILDRQVDVPGEMRVDEWLPAWNQVVSNYERQGQGVEDAQENFMVAKILTCADEYDLGSSLVNIGMPTGVTFTV